MIICLEEYSEPQAHSWDSECREFLSYLVVWQRIRKIHLALDSVILASFGGGDLLPW